MAMGLGVLRLPPSHFWSMTPRELAAASLGAFGPPPSRSAPSRVDLTRLMLRFPDR